MATELAYLELDGGCYCGAIRYRVVSCEPKLVYCHCNICRKVTGAPVSAFLCVLYNEVVYTQGEPVQYNSSTHAQRSFCGQCGGHLIYRDVKDKRYAALYVGSLDTPALPVPCFHVWTAHQLPWLKIHDDLPRYKEKMYKDF